MFLKETLILLLEQSRNKIIGLKYTEKLNLIEVKHFGAVSIKYHTKHLLLIYINIKIKLKFTIIILNESRLSRAQGIKLKK